MRSLFWIAASLLSTAASLPTAARDTDAAPIPHLFDWTPDLARYYSAVGKRIRKSDDEHVFSPTCDLSNAQMPESELEEPEDGLKLLHVVIGRGTQNYTCKGLSEDDEPEATGAVATLFNASCIAANYPDVLDLLPRIALQFPNPPNDLLEPGNLILAGDHFFNQEGVPVFDLGEGYAFVTKLDAVDAPQNALAGQNGRGEGACPWLLLGQKENTTGNVKQVYRLNTAGGNPPPTCKDNDDEFTVEYAAEYWFYGV